MRSSLLKLDFLIESSQIKKKTNNRRYCLGFGSKVLNLFRDRAYTRFACYKQFGKLEYIYMTKIVTLESSLFGYYNSYDLACHSNTFT